MSVARFAVLLRGVNVGGANKLPMVALREALSRQGFARVETYIQSGNVALDADVAHDDLAVAASVRDCIAAAFGLELTVVVRRHDELLAVVADNPFAEHVGKPTTVHVGFAAEPIDATNIVAPAGSIDQFAIAGREVYFYCPGGIGRAKLPNVDRQAKVAVTVRNWNTVLKLVSMTQP